MKKAIAATLVVFSIINLMACSTVGTGSGGFEDSYDAASLTAEAKDATRATMEANDEVYELLDFDDEREYEFAIRGFMTAPESLVIKSDEGMTVWSQDVYDFVRGEEEAPSTANPSLWRNTRNNAVYGLFEVSDGIYQVRGYDVSNITFVRSLNGWIVMDCASSRYTSAKALELFRSQMGDVNIVAIIISHAHADHYGGIGGLIDADDAADPTLSLEEQIASGKTAIIVPQGFEEAVMKENVFAGNAMRRRTFYQYGSLLPCDAQGRLSVGIGLTVVTGGTTYISPTYEIDQDVFETEIDGVKAVFQLTPGTEAPAEMNTYFPDSKALWMAENCTGTMHNLYTLRGAEVRDANDWAHYITEAQSLFPEAQVVFQSHNWPHWGSEVVQEYLTNTAAVYKFIHDQTLLYINQGYTSTEIASMIELPDALEKVWYTRQYYGTLKHNVKAVYQKYMGWYDANPIHLDELEPSEYARKLVEYLGDVDKVIEMARKDYEAGEFQWVAQISNALVFADPDNVQARYLCADALEQLGYQSESGAWRNAYLVAALELRKGTDVYPRFRVGNVNSTAKGMDSQTALDYLGIVIDARKLEDISFTMNLELDDGETFLLRIHHGVLLYYKGVDSYEADLTVSTSREGIIAIAAGVQEEVDRLVAVEEGDASLLQRLCESVVQPELYFNIVEP